MRRSVAAAALVGLLGVQTSAQERAGVATDIAARAESPTNAAYRYRAAIAGLLQLKPGMTGAEVGATSGFVARAMAPQVGPTGRVIRYMVYALDGKTGQVRWEREAIYIRTESKLYRIAR